MKQRTEKGAWRGPAALAVALVYALGVENLMNWLGPVWFALVNAGVIAAVWILEETSPHSLHYAAPRTAPTDDGERVTVREILWIVAAVIVLAAVLRAVIPSLLG